MKTEFIYRMHRKRTLASLAGVIILVPIQLKISEMMHERYFIPMVLVTVIVYQVVFDAVTEKKFIKKGYYKFENENLKICLQKNYDMDIRNIRRIDCFESTKFREKFLVFKIRSDRCRITILIPDFVEKPEYQICLKTAYGEDAFEKKVDRISQISVTYEEKTNEILKDTDNFNVQAYIAEFNWNHCYEYALVFPETKQVTYVFVQCEEKRSEI